MTKFVDETEVVGTAVAPRFVSDFEVTGVPPPPPTFLDNLQGFLLDADSWKDMGKRAAQVGLGTGDLVLGLPGMLAGSVANLAGRTVGAVQGKSRKETEAKGQEYRAYIPEGFIAPLQTAARSLGLPPLDQSGMEAVMNAAGGFVDKQTGGVISDQDAKDAIEMVFLRGGIYAQKSINSAVRGKIDAKYGPKQAATGDRRGDVTWKEEVEPQQQATPKVAPKTPEQVIAESKARIDKKRQDVRAAVKAETPEEKVARMAVKQLEEGEAIWTNGGVDYPVRVNGPAEKGPDGQYYTPVKYGDNTSYVPTKELSPAKPPEPQVGLPKPAEAAPRAFLPDEATPKTRLTEGKVLGEAIDPLETALSKSKAGQNFLLDSQERVALRDVQKAQGQIVVPQERVVPRSPYNSIIKPTPRRPLETGLAKLRSVSQLDSMDQAQLRAAPGNLLTLDERAALRATNAAGAKVVGADGKPLGSGFTQDGAVDTKMLAALGITSAAVWAALRPEDMEKLAMMGVIGATAISGEARSVGALVKEGAPYHFETMLKLPQGATLLSKQQVMDMAKKFPAEAPIVERVLAGVEGNKISAAELHQGLVEETAGWKLAPKETGQYADYGLENIERYKEGKYDKLPGQEPSIDVQPTTTLFRLPEHMQVSDANHFGDNRLYGWTRSFKEDGVTHVVEIQSDLAQHMKELTPEKRAVLEERLAEAKSELRQWVAEVKDREGWRKEQAEGEVNRYKLQVTELETALAAGTAAESLSPIIKNWPRRLIRETLLKNEKQRAYWEEQSKIPDNAPLDGESFAQKLEGLSKVRFASADTVAKVEGWHDAHGPYGSGDLTQPRFQPGHQSIYNRYAGEITRYLKGLGGKEYTDVHGHTWWEVPTDAAKQSYGPGIKMLGAADPELLAKLGAGVALGAYLVANPDKVEMALGGLALGMAVKGGPKGILDADLLRHIQEGGAKAEGAAAELYRRYAPQMMRTLQGKFGKQNVDIEEAVQDGFFHSLKVVAKGHFRGDAEFPTYLHRAVVNRALNQLRAAASRPDTISLTEDPNTGRSALAETLGHDDTPANRLQSRDLGTQIDKALDSIDPRFRDAFLAVERDGLSYEEAAAQQNIPINTLRSRIYRAKAAMQEKLADYQRGAGRDQTPTDYSTPPKPRMGDYERGGATQDVLTTMGLIAGSSAIGGVFYDDPLKGAIVGGILAAGNGILKTHPVQRAVMRGTTRLAEVLPSLRRSIRDMEMEAAIEVNRASDLISAAVRPLKALSKEQQAQWESLYKSANTEGLHAFMQGKPELIAGYRALRAYLQAAGERLIEHGRFKEGVPDYLPLVVKDYKGLMDSLGIQVKEGLQGALMKARMKSLREAGRELNEVEKAIVTNNYLLNEPSTSYLPSFAKHRRLKMTPEREKFYHDYETALIHHAHAVVADLTRTDFFGKDVRTRKAGKQKFTDVEASISALVGRAIEEGRLTPEGSIEVQQVLRARFIGGEQAPAPWLQDVRNTTGFLLLGQIGSGLIQTSESLLSAAHHGFIPSIKAVATLATGKGIKPSEFGLANHVIEEVIGSRLSGRALSTLLKVNLLAPLDQLGISQNLTASFIKLKAMASTPAGQAKLAAKWGADYGPDLPRLIKELQRSTVKARTPLVDSVLWQEISDVRPTSRIEAPELMNAHPNARLMYHLRQFMLTQADIIYRTSVLEMKRGNVARGMANLMKYAVAYAVVGIPADAIKNWIFGRELELDKIDYVENFTRNFGLSRYTMDQIGGSKKPVKATVEAAQQFLTPPAFSVAQRLGEGLPVAGDPEKLVSMVPLAGRAIENRYLGGNVRHEISEARQAKARGEPVHLSPAAKAYLRQKKKERDAEKKEADKKKGPTPWQNFKENF